MMEKRNFVTSVRTPGGTSVSDMDDIANAGAAAFSGKRVKKAADKGKYEKAASAKDEQTDRM